MRSLLFLLSVALASAKIFNRCELAKVLKDNGMDGYHGYSLANWVCMTEWESSYNTRAINHNVDKKGRRVSTDYGIFQINSRWWCDNGETRTANGCNIMCSEVTTDDISVAINCAKRVVRDPNAMSAWYGWSNHCEGRDLSSYVSDCNL